MGHGALGIGHGAWGMGHWEEGQTGHWALGFYNIGIERKGRFSDRFCHPPIIP
ncbi:MULTISPECIES: hypothetical protein [unclassified Microcoleus]|uniref:hypothetical protein n=1 Tax=unclassified Microcoleus TaxID=2642155 RepID=UPI0025D5310D|nr:MULTISPECIES: hypothetical protein [unclassified Microcoleus]